MLKVQEIREIIKLIDQSSINEFTYETDESTIKLKKANQNTGIKTTEIPVEPVKQEQASENEAIKEVVKEKKENEVVTTEPTQSENESTVDYDYEIVSPMVGTLYRASSPEIDPYVKKGSNVSDDTTVCIVEAMKLFNEIEAEVTGEIVEILVEDGELVEYGQPLFRVKTK